MEEDNEHRGENGVENGEREGEKENEQQMETKNGGVDMFDSETFDAIAFVNRLFPDGTMRIYFVFTIDFFIFK